MPTKSYILPVIIIAQLCCTSIWFGGNVVVDQLLPSNAGHGIAAYLLSAVQFGFIIGTLVFAFLAISDRFSPSKVFFWSAIVASLSNFLLLLFTDQLLPLLLLRGCTGFFLAGIYPVGMKIASDYYQNRLGKALGFLVGALVLGTALPHLFKFAAVENSAEWVLIGTSLLTFFGGLLLFLCVKDGPYRVAASRLQLHTVPALFKVPTLRTAAVGYFGHMWELYAFWGIIPYLVFTHMQIAGSNLNLSLWSFLILAIGAIGCILGGYRALQIGSEKVAANALIASGVCCLITPFAIVLPSFVFLTLLLIWGFTVITDSPQFSTMVAAAAPIELRGTALTIVNCIGYAIGIISIQLVSFLIEYIDSVFGILILTAGPLVGNVFLILNRKQKII